VGYKEFDQIEFWQASPMRTGDDLSNLLAIETSLLSDIGSDFPSTRPDSQVLKDGSHLDRYGVMCKQKRAALGLAWHGFMLKMLNICMSSHHEHAITI
jgi:hypothetical protein